MICNHFCFRIIIVSTIFHHNSKQTLMEYVGSPLLVKIHKHKHIQVLWIYTVILLDANKCAFSICSDNHHRQHIHSIDENAMRRRYACPKIYR